MSKSSLACQKTSLTDEEYLGIERDAFEKSELLNEKLDSYMTLEDLTDYVLVEQDEIRTDGDAFRFV